MKKLVYFLVAALSVGTATSVGAQESPLYVGGKVGLMDADFSGFDQAVNIGATIGYDLFSDVNGSLAVEGEFTTTLSDGDINGGGEWDADTLAAYGVYRTSGDLYAKVKAGFLDQDIKRAGTGGGSISGDDSGFSFGAGAGWRMGRGSAFELEYTVASDDLTFISLGYVARF